MLIRRTVRAVQLAVLNSVGASWMVRAGLRKRLMRGCGITVGIWADILPGQRILGHGVVFGQCFINVGCLFDPGSSTIHIEDGVSLATGVTITAATHEIGVPERRSGTHVSLPVRICAGVWLGSGAVLPGVTVGQGAVVAAGSIVREDVPSNALVAGSPATVRRLLPTSTQVS